MMTYTLKDAHILIRKGLVNLPVEDLSKLLETFFGGNKRESPILLNSGSCLGLSEMPFVEIFNTMGLETLALETTPTQEVDFGLLRKLDGSYGPHNASRVMTSIKKYLYRQQEKSDISIFEQRPTDAQALSLYNEAMDSVNSGQIDNPWEYQRSLGKGSFELLTNYLRERKLII